MTTSIVLFLIEEEKAFGLVFLIWSVILK